MRALPILLLLLAAFTGGALAQTPLDVGPPEAAFAGGPIHLSKNAASLLRQHYQGDKVPLVPQPFRGRLDTALAAHDWQRVEAVKNDLTAAQGIVAALAWEQSRFIATGSVGVAEQHALDMAATGSTTVSETAVMLWFYAVAVTLVDGHKCVDAAAPEAYLDRLRGPAFDSVTRLVRSIPDDRLAAMRDLAIRLETVLAPDRTDDSMCREGDDKANLRTDPAWKTEAAATRAMLSRHLVALAAVMRPQPIARPEPPQMVAAKPSPAPVVMLPMLPLPVLALPVPYEPPPQPIVTLRMQTNTVTPEPSAANENRGDASSVDVSGGP